MAEKSYAVVKDSRVINLVIFDDPTEETLNIFKEVHGADAIILATDNSTIDGEYDGEKFWKIKPYESWVKNQEENTWTAPVPYPVIDKENFISYEWNEETISWEEINGN